MKNIIQTICVALCLLSSCMPDHCRDTVCNNEGICVEGFCSCLNGYEGSHCDETWNTRFLGDWNGTEELQGDTLQYPVLLIGNGMPGQFLIMNLGNGIDSVVCLRKSYNEFAIANHKIDSITSISAGSGVLDTLANKIVGGYTIRVKDSTAAYLITLAK